MRCYMEDCQNETNERCCYCGEPVCWQHAQRFSPLFPVPNRFFTNTEPICDRCVNRLLEGEQASSEQPDAV